MVNKVTLIGHLGKDPEIKHLESGVVVGRFTMATNENYMDKKSGEWQSLTTWHDIVVWRNNAERAEKQLKKGSFVYVDGKLQKRKWTDKDGNDRWSVEVVANYFRSLDKREASDASRDGGFPSANDELPGKVEENIESAPLEDDLPF